MDAKDFSCVVCEEEYSDDLPPHTLSCGHSLCGQCLQQIFSNDKKCHECHSTIKASTVEDVPVSCALLKLARSCKALQGEQQKEEKPQTARKMTQQAGECETHGSYRFFRCQSCCVWVCRDCLVLGHPEPPNGSCRIVSIAQALTEEKETYKTLTHSALSKISALTQQLGAQKAQLSTKEKEHEDLVDQLTAYIKQIKSKSCDVTVQLKNLEMLPNLVKESSVHIANAQTPWDMTVATQSANICFAKVKRVVQEIETFLLAADRVIGTTFSETTTNWFPFPFPYNTFIYSKRSAPIANAFSTGGFTFRSATAPTGNFSSSNNAQSLFGQKTSFGSSPAENVSSAGRSSSLFGQPSTTSASVPSATLFGSQSTPSFGQTSSTGPSSTPFGSQTTPFGQTSSTGPSSTPFGSQSTPFGQTSSAPFGSQSPSSFGQTSSTGPSATPFGCQSTPFGQTSSTPFGSQSLPFGQTSSTPFGSQSTPFGQTSSTGLSSTPFGSQSTPSIGQTLSKGPSSTLFGQNASS